MQKNRDAKDGFNIGWDYYAHSLALPEYLRGEECKSCIDGFNAAKSKKVTQNEHDRYIRKWLLLRINAWKRNRFVDEAVTPEFIKSLDDHRCPVTGVELTHGTGLDTDWSVDRINNDAAYAIGNIVVVSARANQIKGNYSHLEIIDFAYNENAEPAKNIKGIEQLTRVEWALSPPNKKPRLRVWLFTFWQLKPVILM